MRKTLTLFYAFFALTPAFADDLTADCRWKKLPLQNIPENVEPSAVKTFGANDSWIGGSFRMSRQIPGVPQPAGQVHWEPALYHLTGDKWTEVKIPAELFRSPYATGEGHGSVTKIKGTSSRDLYVGINRYRDDSGVLLHWNGTAFSQIENLPPARGLTDIQRSSDGATWFFGSKRISSGTFFSGPIYVPYSYRLKDGRMEEFTSAFVNSSKSVIDIGDYMKSVVLAPNDIYAVGYGKRYIDGTVQYDMKPLFEHFDGTKWSEVNLPSLPSGIVSFDSIGERDGKLMLVAIGYAFLYDKSEGTWNVLEAPVPYANRRPRFDRVSGLASGKWLLLGFDDDPAYSRHGGPGLDGAWVIDQGKFSTTTHADGLEISPRPSEWAPGFIPYVKYLVSPYSPTPFTQSDVADGVAFAAGSLKNPANPPFNPEFANQYIPFIQRMICR